MEQKIFDHIIPLGRNCEIAFQFKRCFGFLESFPLNWCFITDHYKLLELLEHEDILWSKNIRRDAASNMFFDEATKINFHAEREPIAFAGFSSEELDAEVRKEFANLQSKTAYLFEKLHTIWSSGESQLYVLALDMKTMSQVEAYLVKLQEILKNRTSNYSILAIVEKCIEGECSAVSLGGDICTQTGALFTNPCSYQD